MQYQGSLQQTSITKRSFQGLRLLTKSILCSGVACGVCGLVFSGHAFADGGDYYIQGSLGAALTDKTGSMEIKDQTGDTEGFDSGDLGTGMVLDFGVGHEITDDFRLDLTFNYRLGHEVNTYTNRIDTGGSAKGWLNSYGMMANATYDVVTFKMGNMDIKPYVSGGVGLAVNDLNDVRITVDGIPTRLKGKQKLDFAWQAGGGVGIGLSDTVTLDAGYRYSDLGSFESGKDLSALTTNQRAILADPLEGDYTNHEIKIGLRYRF